MQKKNYKTLYIRKIIGETITELRTNQNISGNKLANEYDIGNGNLSKIENSLTDCKLITLWRISEALGMKLSDFILLIEKKLGNDFKLTDE